MRVTTGWLTAAVAGERVLNQRIVTDPERFWDHFQSQTLTAIYHDVMTVHKGKPRPEDGPYFGQLTVDLTLSEPDYSLGVDKEHISPMESLHEEIFFGVGHFFDLLGRFTRGTFRATSFGSLSYRGRVVPIMRRKSDGKPGRAKITLTGFGSPRPGVVIDYRERNGRKDHARLDIPKVALERPQALAARVRDGQNGRNRAARSPAQSRLRDRPAQRARPNLQIRCTASTAAGEARASATSRRRIRPTEPSSPIT